MSATSTDGIPNISNWEKRPKYTVTITYRRTSGQKYQHLGQLKNIPVSWTGGHIIPWKLGRQYTWESYRSQQNTIFGT
jgi:hypothetical protein